MDIHSHSFWENIQKQGLSYIESIFLTLYDISCFPKWLHHLAHLPAVYESSTWSTSLPAFGIVSFFNSSGYAVEFHCGLILYFPNDTKHIFRCPFLLHTPSLMKCVFKSFAHVFTGFILYEFIMHSGYNSYCRYLPGKQYFLPVCILSFFFFFFCRIL